MKWKRRYSTARAPLRYCPTSGKVMFDKRGAATARNLRYRQARIELRIYPCPQCGAWHLTSRL